MDEDALPQRANARRRLREPQPAGYSSDPQAASACVTTYIGRAAEQSKADKGPGPDREPLASCGDSSSDGAREGHRTAFEPLAQPESRGTGAETNGSEDGGGNEAFAYRSAAVGDYKFEYLDHTADVQLHAWGANLTEAFENCALAMFNYMSPLEHVQLREARLYRAEGHDLQSLLYNFLDELLFVFSTELFLAGAVRIKSFDRTSFMIEAEGMGEIFDRNHHEVGTEIKAITYSAMSIAEREDDADVFVIVDI